MHPRRRLRHHGGQPSQVQEMPLPTLPGSRNDRVGHLDGGAEEAPFPEDAAETRGHDEPPERGGQGGDQVADEQREHLPAADVGRAPEHRDIFFTPNHV